MKCPKCGYLGFEDIERCRNCGYDFSLVTVQNTPELSLRPRDSQDNRAFGDLILSNGAVPGARGAEPRVAGGGRPGAGPSSGELPLFGTDVVLEDDAPLITRPSPPRPPLAVRRSTPEVPKLRPGGRTSMLDLGEESGRGPILSSAARARRVEWPADREPRIEAQPAALGARGLAAAIDLAILGVIDVVVVYFTMQICGLTVQDLAVLPQAPLIAFLVVQNGGYLVAFTAGGQTLGKMAAGIRIVPAQSNTSVDLARSIVRTVVWVALALPAGLGFLTALIGREHRGLHDRCAGTRVIRASA